MIVASVNKDINFPLYSLCILFFSHLFELAIISSTILNGYKGNYPCVVLDLRGKKSVFYQYYLTFFHKYSL